MEINTLITIVVTVLSILSIILAPSIYIFRNLMQRVEQLESAMQQKINEADVRIIMADKIDPIKSDLEEIKSMQQTILTHFIRNQI